MNPLYTTGQTPDGTLLMGGIWQLWQQEGLPIEISHLRCQDSHWTIDWMEALADASTTNNGPALIQQMEAFLPADELNRIKASYGALLNAGKTHQQILDDKRAKAA
jgi:hypothetical protein